MRKLFGFTIILAVSLSSFCYFTQITMDTTATASLSNFNTDLSLCSCDLSTACDTFCCCDTKCTAADILNWNNNNWCIEKKTVIERYCDQIGKTGLSSFEDMGCVMYSNRGEIGKYYATPNTNNFVDPAISKFASQSVNAQLVKQYIVPDITAYQLNSPIKMKSSTSTKAIIVWLSSVDQSCRQNYVPLKQGTTTSACLYSITDTTSCENINKQLQATASSICSSGSCSSVLSSTIINIAPSLYTTSVSGSTCSNFASQIIISLKIGYSNGEYKISNGSFTYVPLTSSSKKVYLKTTIIIAKEGIENSGNPGYLIGKPVQYITGGIYEFADPTDKSCLGSQSNLLLGISFGVNQTFSCLTNAPCSTGLYIDQIAKGDFKFKKYASQSAQSVNTTGVTGQNCAKQSYTLYILYSYSGWVLDPQYYILDSLLVAESSADGSIKMKQLNIKWIKMQPDSVNKPPTNNFYKYFEYLWTPLKNSVYKLTNV